MGRLNIYFFLCVFTCFVHHTLGGSTAKGESCYSKEDEEGQCVTFDECLPYLKLLRDRPISKSNLRLVVNLTCTFDLHEPLICCPLKDIYNSQNNFLQTRRAKPLPEDDSFKVHRNFNLLPSFSECSLQSNQPTRRGSKVGRGEYPWIALLGYLNPKTGMVEFLCGGTVINNRYVLTAAHCVRKTGLAKPTVVRLGEHDLVNDPDCSNAVGQQRLRCSYAQDVGIERIIPHFQYERSETSFFQKHDVALLRLSEDVKFNEFIRPVCLPLFSEYGMLRNPDRIENSTGLSAGWGKSIDTQQGSTVIKAISLPIKTKEQCTAYYFTRNEITPDQICAGGEKVACGGDSGGPLMIAYREKYSSPKLVQIGVTSFGPVYCQHQVPSIYTKVSSYLSWILDTIQP